MEREGWAGDNPPHFTHLQGWDRTGPKVRLDMCPAVCGHVYRMFRHVYGCRRNVPTCQGWDRSGRCDLIPHSPNPASDRVRLGHCGLDTRYTPAVWGHGTHMFTPMQIKCHSQVRANPNSWLRSFNIFDITEFETRGS